MKSSDILNLFKYALTFSPKLLIVAIVAWILSFALGLSTGLLYENLPEQFQQQLITTIGLSVSNNPTIIEVMKSIGMENYIFTILIIFFNNLYMSLLIMVSSMTVLLGFLIVFTNGYLLGFLYGLVHIMYSPFQILGIIIFGILEIAAYCIAMAFGFRLIVSILFPKKIKKARMRRFESFKSALKGFKKIILVIALFLLTAAVIESIVAINIKNTSENENSKVFDQCGISFQQIISGSPAEKSGLEPFYRIIKVDNERIYNTTDFTEVMKKYSPGDNVTLESASGKKFNVILEPPKDNNHTVFIGLNNVYTAPVLAGKCT